MNEILHARTARPLLEGSSGQRWSGVDRTDYTYTGYRGQKLLEGGALLLFSLLQIPPLGLEARGVVRRERAIGAEKRIAPEST